MPLRRTLAPILAALTIAMCLLFGTAAAAQSVPARSRPKVGIALAGGGALGLAHIGVLQWLEEHHIPIDAITGTSMGGIVGGCYATGMSASEIKGLFESIPWNEALAPGASFRSLPFRRKEDLRAVPTRLIIGLAEGLSLPNGFVPGQPINMLLSRVALPYGDLKSFDALPTPFRCMAVDLEKGTSVTIKDGSLATALRATMAVPGLFTPAERNGRTLVDGGLLNNLPTEAVKEMGPDIIIAVPLSSPAETAALAKSLSGILNQALTISTSTNELRSLELADIIIKPDLHTLTGIDFAELQSFIQLGYRGAEARKSILERLALSDADWNSYLAQRQARRRTADALIQFIDVAGQNRVRKAELENRLKRYVGGPLNSQRLEADLTGITAEGRYQNMLFQKTQRDGKTGLLIDPQERKYGPPFLKLGIVIDGSDTDNIRFNVASRLVALDAGSPGAEVRADLRLGSDRDALVEYYRPFGTSRYFIAPRLFYSDDAQSIFQNGFHAATYGTRTAGVALDFGYNSSRLSEFRLGYQFNHLRANIRSGSPVLPALSGEVNAASLRWNYDGQDSENIPTRGIQLNANAAWYGSDPGSSGPYPKLEFKFSSFRPLRDRQTLFLSGGIGTTFGNTAGTLQQFTTGGPFRLGAYGPNEFRGNDYVLLSAGWLYRLGQLPGFLGGKILVGSWYEVGGAFARFDRARYSSDLSAGFVAETLLGPVVVGGSYGEAGRRSVYFAIGRLF